MPLSSTPKLSRLEEPGCQKIPSVEIWKTEIKVNVHQALCSFQTPYLFSLMKTLKINHWLDSFLWTYIWSQRVRRHMTVCKNVSSRFKLQNLDPLLTIYVGLYVSFPCLRHWVLICKMETGLASSPIMKVKWEKVILGCSVHVNSWYWHCLQPLLKICGWWSDYSLIFSSLSSLKWNSVKVGFFLSVIHRRVVFLILSFAHKIMFLVLANAINF